EEAQDRYGIPKDNVFFIGYSQDHHFYLMTGDDWVQGGYSPSMDIWGWKEGDYYSDKSMELLGKVAQGDDQAREKVDHSKPWLKPLFATEKYAKHVPVPPTATDPSRAGKIIKQPPESMERLDLISFSWEGGFTNADWPIIDLQVFDNSAWKDVVNKAGRKYNDDGDRIVVDYDWSQWKSFDWAAWENGEVDQGDRKNLWSARFEELMDFPTGRYRFRIRGKYCPKTDQCDAWGNGLKDYETFTREFELKKTTKLKIWDVSYESGNLKARVGYPSGHLATDNGGLSKSLSMKSYRFRGLHIHPFAPGELSTEKGDVSIEVSAPGLPQPVTSDQLQSMGKFNYEFVEWRRDDYSEKQCSEKGGTWSAPYCEGRSTVKIDTVGFSIPVQGLAAGTTVTIKVTDKFGNTGSLDYKL
ncbi:MAG: hypothetical protein GXP49_00165, partial [Deltaproteobacteria bacterium]|nr:hypothetical protein [Deltaproteobacteria bacterium]